MDQFHFKVNLKGMIDLLSNHLYSTPHVFIRELLQNAVDAITARHKVEPAYDGKINVEVYAGENPTIFIEDNGLGLSEEEVHYFLSQIGQTSKRGEDGDDYIGRFGVGLLSCFIVSDEIVLLTRSVKSEQTVKWRGKPDGSYTIEKVDSEMRPGTRIYLQAKSGYEHYFRVDQVKQLCEYYGEFLPYPIHFSDTRDSHRLNAELAPWEMTIDQALAYGRQRYEEDYLDAIPLRSTVGEAHGVAYILPYAVRINAKQTSRVYVKQMLLSEKVDKLLPSWSFFVKGVINVNQLRPTASREEFYEDPLLDVVRNELGDCIKRYLVQLVEKDPDLLAKIIQIHYESIKTLAKEDNELYRLFIDWLPFETSFGRMKLKEIREQSPTIFYTPSLDEFRQITQVAKAQSFCVVNTAYVHDTELIEKLPMIDPTIQIKRVNPTTFTDQFMELSFEERGHVYDFIRIANIVLQPYLCKAEIKKFNPDELPALYTTNEEALFWRTVEQTKEESNELFSSIIGQMSGHQTVGQLAQLCFNYQNPIIQRAIKSEDEEMKRMIVEVLYIQSLLLGHYPLRQQELHLLNNGLIRLIEKGMDANA
ncbi:molecular chaperone HtpG [Seinonella peptonophila]|uniref:Molecular chaperone HtpG n=1 Tax=Seinonella peptonophila TaxID=112248 RepID=A0A1M4XHL0_9BACL|nr:HSP90 family protein [Seinonella peptonophila]SHE92995.1 molecular chaperone HtpG [Seinonella peptonophila]